MTCKPCRPGTYVRPPCTDKQTYCVLCPRGRYSSEWSTSRECRPCSSCQGFEEIVKKPCTRNANTQCGCPTGYWHYKPGTDESKCLPYHKCGIGFGVTVPGTNVSDVSCGLCSKGSNFSDIINYYSPCKSCTRCGELGWEELKACTVKSDAKCKVITTKAPTLKPTTSKEIDVPGRNTPAIDQKSYPQVFDTNAVIIALAAIVSIIVMGLAVYFFYKRRKGHWRSRGTGRPRLDSRNKEDSGSQEPLNPSGSPEVVVKYTRRSSIADITRPNVRRRSSSVCPVQLSEDSGPPRSPPILEIERPPFPPSKKKEGVALTDIFIWIGSDFGVKGHKSFLQSLPSNETKGRLEEKRDIEAIEYKHKDDFQEIITAGLEKWRGLNAETTDDQIFIDVFNAMVTVKRFKLAKEMCEKYADDS